MCKEKKKEKIIKEVLLMILGQVLTNMKEDLLIMPNPILFNKKDLEL